MRDQHAPQPSASERPYELMIRAYLTAAALHQFERVRHFIETEGLHPDSTYRSKPTALCYAVLKPYPCLMRYLFEKGADIDHADGAGMTPLHYAALGGSEDCLGYLLCCGARLDLKNRYGETALTLASGRPGLGHCTALLLRSGPGPTEPAARASCRH